jgi:hypothetical protein
MLHRDLFSILLTCQSLFYLSDAKWELDISRGQEGSGMKRRWGVLWGQEKSWGGGKEMWAGKDEV